MIHYAVHNVEEASLRACLLAFVSQMARNPLGANLPVAETFMNDVPNGASGKIEPSFQLSNTHTSACSVASVSWTGSAKVEGRKPPCSTMIWSIYLPFLRRCIQNNFSRKYKICRNSPDDNINISRMYELLLTYQMIKLIFHLCINFFTYRMIILILQYFYT